MSNVSKVTQTTQLSQPELDEIQKSLTARTQQAFSRTSFQILPTSTKHAFYSAYLGANTWVSKKYVEHTKSVWFQSMGRNYGALDKGQIDRAEKGYLRAKVVAENVSTNYKNISKNANASTPADLQTVLLACLGNSPYSSELKMHLQTLVEQIKNAKNPSEAHTYIDVFTTVLKKALSYRSSATVGLFLQFPELVNWSDIQEDRYYGPQIHKAFNEALDQELQGKNTVDIKGKIIKTEYRPLILKGLLRHPGLIVDRNQIMQIKGHSLAQKCIQELVLENSTILDTFPTDSINWGQMYDQFYVGKKSWIDEARTPGVIDWINSRADVADDMLQKELIECIVHPHKVDWAAVKAQTQSRAAVIDAVLKQWHQEAAKKAIDPQSIQILRAYGSQQICIDKKIRTFIEGNMQAEASSGANEWIKDKANASDIQTAMNTKPIDFKDISNDLSTAIGGHTSYVNWSAIHANGQDKEGIKEIYRCFVEQELQKHPIDKKALTSLLQHEGVLGSDPRVWNHLESIASSSGKVFLANTRLSIEEREKRLFADLPIQKTPAAIEECINSYVPGISDKAVQDVLTDVSLSIKTKVQVLTCALKNCKLEIKKWDEDCLNIISQIAVAELAKDLPEENLQQVADNIAQIADACMSTTDTATQKSLYTWISGIFSMKELRGVMQLVNWKNINSETLPSDPELWKFIFSRATPTAIQHWKQLFNRKLAGEIEKNAFLTSFIKEKELQIMVDWKMVLDTSTFKDVNKRHFNEFVNDHINNNNYREKILECHEYIDWENLGWNRLRLDPINNPNVLQKIQEKYTDLLVQRIADGDKATIQQYVQGPHVGMIDWGRAFAVIPSADIEDLMNDAFIEYANKTKDPKDLGRIQPLYTQRLQEYIQVSDIDNMDKYIDGRKELINWNVAFAAWDGLDRTNPAKAIIENSLKDGFSAYVSEASQDLNQTQNLLQYEKLWGDPQKINWKEVWKEPIADPQILQKVKPVYTQLLVGEIAKEEETAIREYVANPSVIDWKQAFVAAEKIPNTEPKKSDIVKLLKGSFQGYLQEVITNKDLPTVKDLLAQTKYIQWDALTSMDPTVLSIMKDAYTQELLEHIKNSDPAQVEIFTKEVDLVDWGKAFKELDTRTDKTGTVKEKLQDGFTTYADYVMKLSADKQDILAIQNVYEDPAVLKYTNKNKLREHTILELKAAIAQNDVAWLTIIAASARGKELLPTDIAGCAPKDKPSGNVAGALQELYVGSVTQRLIRTCKEIEQRFKGRSMPLNAMQDAIKTEIEQSLKLSSHVGLAKVLQGIGSLEVKKAIFTQWLKLSYNSGGISKSQEFFKDVDLINIPSLIDGIGIKNTLDLCFASHAELGNKTTDFLSKILDSDKITDVSWNHIFTQAQNSKNMDIIILIEEKFKRGLQGELAKVQKEDRSKQIAWYGGYAGYATLKPPLQISWSTAFRGVLNPNNKEAMKTLFHRDIAAKIDRNENVDSWLNQDTYAYVDWGKVFEKDSLVTGKTQNSADEYIKQSFMKSHSADAQNNIESILNSPSFTKADWNVYIAMSRNGNGWQPFIQKKFNDAFYAEIENPTDGKFKDIGPYINNGTELEYRDISWNKVLGSKQNGVRNLFNDMLQKGLAKNADLEVCLDKDSYEYVDWPKIQPLKDKPGAGIWKTKFNDALYTQLEDIANGSNVELGQLTSYMTCKGAIEYREKGPSWAKVFLNSSLSSLNKDHITSLFHQGLKDGLTNNKDVDAWLNKDTYQYVDWKEIHPGKGVTSDVWEAKLLDYIQTTAKDPGKVLEELQDLIDWKQLDINKYIGSLVTKADADKGSLELENLLSSPDIRKQIDWSKLAENSVGKVGIKNQTYIYITKYIEEDLLTVGNQPQGLRQLFEFTNDEHVKGLIIDTMKWQTEITNAWIAGCGHKNKDWIQIGLKLPLNWDQVAENLDSVDRSFVQEKVTQELLDGIKQYKKDTEIETLTKKWDTLTKAAEFINFGEIASQIPSNEQTAELQRSMKTAFNEILAKRINDPNFASLNLVNSKAYAWIDWDELLKRVANEDNKIELKRHLQQYGNELFHPNNRGSQLGIALQIKSWDSSHLKSHIEQNLQGAIKALQAGNAAWITEWMKYDFGGFNSLSSILQTQINKLVLDVKKVADMALIESIAKYVPKGSVNPKQPVITAERDSQEERDIRAKLEEIFK